VTLPLITDCRCPDKRHELIFTLPQRFPRNDDSLKFRDISFNTRAEVSEFLVRFIIEPHLADGNALLLVESNLFNSKQLALVDVVLAGIAFISYGCPEYTAILGLMGFDYWKNAPYHWGFLFHSSAR
jgi:hypothetical protein